MVALAARPGLTTHAFGEPYAARLGALPGASEAWVDGLRQTARATLSTRGLPGPREEAWRYTPLGDLAKLPFIPSAAADDIEVASLPTHVMPVADAPCLVTVNGAVRRDLSDVAIAGNHLTVVGLRDAMKGAPASLRSLLGKLAASDQYPMAALNTAYMTDGLVVSVTAGADVKLQIVSIGAAGAEPVAFHPRLVVMVGEGARLTLIERHIGLPGQSYFTNPVTESIVGRGGVLRHFVSVNDDADAFHASVTAVRLHEGATFEGFRLGLGGGKVRQDVAVSFTGERASAILNGAHALGGDDHYDLSTFVDHAVPACTSSQAIKAVVGGRSHAVFQGRIHVARAAQKTDARQNHKALFLNAGPKVDCKPELEIFADDVQCAHGAATGEIDPDHVFYLLSRGIDPDTARALLIEGFLDDAVGKISDEAVRAGYRNAVAVWLKRHAALGAKP